MPVSSTFTVYSNAPKEGKQNLDAKTEAGFSLYFFMMYDVSSRVFSREMNTAATNSFAIFYFKRYVPSLTFPNFETLCFEL